MELGFHSHAVKQELKPVSTAQNRDSNMRAYRDVKTIVLDRDHLANPKGVAPQPQPRCSGPSEHLEATSSNFMRAPAARGGSSALVQIGTASDTAPQPLPSHGEAYFTRVGHDGGYSAPVVACQPFVGRETPISVHAATMIHVVCIPI